MTEPPTDDDLRNEMIELVRSRSLDELRARLEAEPRMRSMLGDGCFDAEAPAIVHAANRGDLQLVDLLLSFGADIHGRSTYWGRTVGVLDESPAEVRTALIERGAVASITPFVEAVQAQDIDAVRRLLESEPALHDLIDKPFFSFATPAIVRANKNRELVELLLDHGADPTVRSLHGFGVLDSAPRDVVELMLERGATLDVHVAAEHGFLRELASILAADSSAASTPGGDGKTPLHVAANAAVVDLLADHGADIDARCSDHESTPLQYLILETEPRERLIARGAHVDIFAAAWLGRLDDLEAELTRVPESIHARIHQDGYDAVRPGSIYSWRIGFKLSPHQAAKQAGHEEAYRWLMDRSPVHEQLINACLCGEDELARRIASAHPDLVANLESRDATRFADAAWRGETAAVELMLELGFDVDTPYDEGPALTGPLLFGNLELAQLLIDRGADLSWRNTYGASPLGVAVWASRNFADSEGDYPGCVRHLLGAGLDIEPWMREGGSEEVRAVLDGS